MHRLLWIFAVIFAASILAETASAATITHGKFKSGREYVLLKGTIGKGDNQTLIRRLIANPNVDRIYFNSPGGLWSEGKALGKTIQRYNLKTLIFKNHKCSSACAIAFVHGSERIMFESGKLGFHFSYFNNKTLDDIHFEEGLPYLQDIIKVAMQRNVLYFMNLPVKNKEMFLVNILRYGNLPADMWYPNNYELESYIGVRIIYKR